MLPCCSVLIVCFVLLCSSFSPGVSQAADDPFPKQVKAGDVTFVTSSEGAIQREEVDERVGWTCLGAGLLYGDVRPVKSAHLRVEFELHDGGYKGNLYVPYDSADDTVLNEARYPGAWKGSQLKLEGKNAWTTVSLEWPDARLAKRCNGHDFRIHMPAAPQIVIASVKVTELPPLPPPVRPLRMPLSAVKANGALVDGELIRIPGRFAQEGDKPIVINAADATMLRQLAGKSLGADGNPAGKRYIHFVEQADYRFTVATAGAYQLWERAYFPVKGSWNHEENLDGKQAFNIIDSPNTLEAGRWHWIKAGKYQMTAGEHTFSLSYHGGARLDRLVFSRDLENPPAGDGGAPSRNLAAAQGVVETADALPMDAAKWMSLDGDLDGRGGEVRVELSADGGATWQPAPADRSLEALKVAGGGKDRLRARLTLIPGADGSSPIVQGLAAKYLPGPNDQLVLANDDLEITFGPVGVRKLRGKKLGTDFVFGGVEAPLFQLQVKPVGQAAPSWIANTQAVVLGHDLNGSTLVQVYHFPQGIDVTCWVKLDGPTSTWAIDIDNRSTLEVCALQYPMLQGVRIGEDAADDTLIMPTFWAQLIRNPVDWNARPIRALAMHWTYLYDDRAGLYLGDHNWPVNDLNIFATRNDPTSLNYGFLHELLVAPGKQRRMRSYVLAVCPGGSWHPGADIYRAWAAKAIQPAQHPDWTRRVDGWCTAPSNNFPYDGYASIPLEHDRALQRGLGFFMGGNRAQIDGPQEYVGMWPTYCPAYGNLQEFRDVLREIRERGGHTNWYFNWQLLSPARVVDRPRIAGLIPRAWVEHPVNWPDKAWYAKTANRWGFSWGEPGLGEDEDEIIQFVGSPTWQKHHHDRTLDWVKLYGADGMYYDQLSCVNNFNGSIEPGYNLYGDYGVWTRAVADDLGRLTKEMRAIDPHFITSGEGCNDVIGQSVDFHMTSGVWNRLEIFRYCFPDQLLLDGGWNGGVQWTGQDKRWRFIWMTGARFEGLWDNPFCNQLQGLRRKVSQLIYPARFMDTVGLELTQDGKPVANPPKTKTSGVEIAPVDGPQAKWFLLAAPSRGAIINVVQDPPAEGEAPPVTISIPTADFGPVKAAWALHLDGTIERLNGQEADGRYRFSLPAKEQATTVLLVNQVGPQVLALDLPFAAAPGARMTGTVTVTHYGPEPAKGSLRWQLPAGWKGDGLTFDIAPGETKQLPVSLTLPATVKPDRYDLTLVTDALGATGTYPHWVSATSALWIRLNHLPDGHVKATIFNRSDKPLKGMLTFTPPKGVTLDTPAQPFSVEPWSQAEAQVLVSGLEPLPAPVHLLADAITGRETAHRSLMLNVPAPNGQFDVDTAGDKHPDWWFCWGTGDERKFNNLVELDPQNPFFGKTSVKINPHPEAGKALWLMPIAVSLDGGHKYRLRVAIRKTLDTDVCYVQANTLRLAGGAADKWTVLEGTFTTPPTSRGLYLRLTNESRHPVWFDALTIERVE